jgi:hypothetical protein
MLRVQLLLTMMAMFMLQVSLADKQNLTPYLLPETERTMPFLLNTIRQELLNGLTTQGGPNDDYATGVCIDTEGFIYITGYFLDSIFSIRRN